MSAFSNPPRLVSLLPVYCCPDTKPQPLDRMVWLRPWMSPYWPGGPPHGKGAEPVWVPGTVIEWRLFMNQERMDRLVNVEGALDPTLPDYIRLFKSLDPLTSYLQRWPVDPVIERAWQDAKRKRTLTGGGGKKRSDFSDIFPSGLREVPMLEMARVDTSVKVNPEWLLEERPELVCSFCLNVMARATIGCKRGHLLCHGCWPALWGMQEGGGCKDVGCSEQTSAATLAPISALDVTINRLRLRCKNHGGGGGVPAVKRVKLAAVDSLSVSDLRKALSERRLSSTGGQANPQTPKPLNPKTPKSRNPQTPKPPDPENPETRRRWWLGWRKTGAQRGVARGAAQSGSYECTWKITACESRCDARTRFPPRNPKPSTLNPKP